jgi:DNA-binding helix-hairpin-helix protein with protein kinase domain/RNA polymerase subunit RPABC4/transcription elongation factor Spt4
VNVYNARRQPVLLGGEVGRGGEATVYKLAVQPALLAKIYHGAPRAGYEDKLAWMQANPPDDPTRAQGHASIAWPNDLLYNAQGQLVGYVMVNVQNAVPLLLVFNPRSRARTLPSFNRRYLHRAARNLAAALGALHASNYIVGDLNESNVMVTPSSLITLIDADSFQVQRRIGAKPVLHPCPVGKLEYTPPELQGKTFALVPRQPEHDRFGLAVLIFQLLMEGNHPFRAQWFGSGDPPPVEDRIRDGAWPYAAQPGQPIAPPRGAPPLETLHPALVKLARQCFVAGHTDPRARPWPEEWEEALTIAEDALTTCALGHLYSRHLTRCPECQALADAQRAARSTAPRPAAPTLGPRLRPSRPTASAANPPPASGTLGSPPWPSAPSLRQLAWSALAAALRPAPAASRALVTCRGCGRVNPVDEIYCQGCARRLSAQRVCANCGRGMPGNAHFCPKCGQSV